MNAIKVEADDERLMREAEHAFQIVTHYPEEGTRVDFSGVFLIYDTMPVDKITERMESIKNAVDGEMG